MIGLGKTNLTLKDSRQAPVRQMVFQFKPVSRLRLDLISRALRPRPHYPVDRGDGLKPAAAIAWQQLSRLANEGHLP